MATIHQIDSARQNGKERSSKNALRHGMHSSAVVLNSEDSTLYDSLLSACAAEYRPANRREHDLVESIVDAIWRLNRILTIEATSLDYEIDKQRAVPTTEPVPVDEGTRAALAFAKLAQTGNLLGLLSRHEGRLRRTIERTQHRLEEMQKCKIESKPHGQVLPPARMKMRERAGGRMRSPMAGTVFRYWSRDRKRN